MLRWFRARRQARLVRAYHQEYGTRHIQLLLNSPKENTR